MRTDRRWGILGFVQQRMRKLAPILWAVAIALIGVRTTGTHLHLCLDGSEPFASVRTSDAEAVSHPGADSHGTHQDQDVDAVGTATVAKKDTSDDSPVAIEAAYAVVARLPPPQRVRGELEPQSSAPRLPYLFRPLLRGPPA